MKNDQLFLLIVTLFVVLFLMISIIAHAGTIQQVGGFVPRA